MLVGEIMTAHDLLTVSCSSSVQEALTRAADRDVHHVLIVDRGRLRGVTCVCDLRERPPTQPLGETIVGPPEVVWPQSTLHEAARRFIEKRVSCFPVCDETGVLIGVITRGDLRRSRIREDELPLSFRCSFCRSTSHVRALPAQPGLAACLECADRAVPASAEHYDVGSKD